MKRINIYGFIIIIISFSSIVALIFSITTEVKVQREISEKHAFLGKNYLSSFESQNRLVFNIHRLLSYDGQGKLPEAIIAEKTALCNSVVSSTKYMQRIPAYVIETLYEDDPLLIAERCKDSIDKFNKIFSNMEKINAELKDTLPSDKVLFLIGAFEDTAREMMSLQESQAFLMSQLNDYIFSHLKRDLEEVTSIIHLFLILHSSLTGVLIITFLLYIILSGKTSRILEQSRDKLEEEVSLRTRDLTTKHEELKEALEEKEFLLKEVHHRVKNSLALINSMVELQAGSEEDQKTRNKLSDISRRIHSIALVHQKIYQSSTLSSIDFKDYTTELSTTIIDSISIQDIEFQFSMIKVQLSPELIIPLGIIITEIVINAVKYGFAGRAKGRIFFSLVKEDAVLVFKIANDGKPFPENIDFRASPSLGFKLVCSLVKQIGGTIELEKKNGTLFVIKFSVPDQPGINNAGASPAGSVS